MKNKIIVNAIPEEAVDCVLGKMDYSGKSYDKPVIMCQADGYLCDLEYYGCCEKLIALGDLSNGCN